MPRDDAGKTKSHAGVSSSETDMSERERRVLVTGGAGFVAPYVVAALRSLIPQGLQITVTARQSEADNAQQAFVPLDMTDAAGVQSVIQSVQPTHVIHLAGIAAPVKAGTAPDIAWDVNLKGALNVARAIITYVPTATLIFAGSGLIYGNSAQGARALRESDLVQPNSDYAATKAAADLALGALVGQGLRVVRCRPFNHSGPGQSEDFVLASFAAQIARIERGLQPPILQVGNLDAERDFLDVRDVANAYALCVLKSQTIAPGTIFNIASGIPTTIRTILDQMLALATVRIDITVDPARWRPNDMATIVGDASAVRRALGWAPAHDTKALAATLVEAARRA